jgi:hypothetical protein
MYLTRGVQKKFLPLQLVSKNTEYFVVLALSRILCEF